MGLVLVDKDEISSTIADSIRRKKGYPDSYKMSMVSMASIIDRMGAKLLKTTAVGDGTNTIAFDIGSRPQKFLLAMGADMGESLTANSSTLVYADSDAAKGLAIVKKSAFQYSLRTVGITSRLSQFGFEVVLADSSVVFENGVTYELSYLYEEL